MAHIALYRKWRSQTFSEIVGQNHIVQALQNALKENRISHAYLFCGPRGTGKTSTAKLFAKAINCTQGNLDEPCNECSICTRMTNGSFMDVIEIDAASNRGIEEIRELRDQVRFTPTESKYKVYIIDEVHMLTTEAFNALLKTLEEPPAHVVFIFATTEVHKLPLTVISRCQRYDFKRVSLSDQINRLTYVCEQETITIEPEAIHYIARLSDGGMRDALSLLDQLTAYSLDMIKLSDVIAMTGGISTEQIEKLVEAMKHHQLDLVLEIIDAMMQDGKSADKCLDLLVDYFRDLLMVNQIPQSSVVTERIYDSQRLMHIANQYTSAEIFQIMDILIHSQNEMKYTTQPQTILEMATMKICTQPLQLSDDVWDRIQRIEAQLSQLSQLQENQSSMPHQNAFTSNAFENLQKPQAMKNSEISQNIEPLLKQEKASPTVHKKASQLDAFVAATKNTQTKDVLMQWNLILSTVKSTKVTVHAWLVNGELVAAHQNELLIAFKNEMHRNTTEKKENKQLIEDVVHQVLGKHYRIVTVMRKEWDEAQKNTPIHKETAFLELVHEEEPQNEVEKTVREVISLFGEEIIEMKD
jgi:DNA polymerase-3 subunit gamma/tau